MIRLHRTHEMDAQKRRVEIARFISEHDGADVMMLAKHFSVSPMTIRRDRKILASQNKIAATHGGAVPVAYLYGEPPYSQKVNVSIEKKRAIAQEAAKLVVDNSCIFLDSGTTTLELAKLLFHRRLSVVTVDLHIALLLSRSPTVKVFTPGGEVDGEMQGQLDIHAVEYVKSINSSMAFIGSAVWDPQKGVSCSTVAKQAIKKALIEQTEKPVLLADSTKFGLCNPWTVADLSAFSYIVTDEELSEENRKAVSRFGGGLMVVKINHRRDR